MSNMTSFIQRFYGQTLVIYETERTLLEVAHTKKINSFVYENNNYIIYTLLNILTFLSIQTK